MRPTPAEQWSKTGGFPSAFLAIPVVESTSFVPFGSPKEVLVVVVVVLVVVVLVVVVGAVEASSSDETFVETGTESSLEDESVESCPIRR